MSARRKLLGRFALDDQLQASIEETGMLELWFGKARPDATVASEDGNHTLAFLSPSGEVAGVLVQDYVDDESRVVPFGFGTLEIVQEDAEVSVFLRS